MCGWVEAREKIIVEPRQNASNQFQSEESRLGELINIVLIG